jgi:hypothetical protein
MKRRPRERLSIWDDPRTMAAQAMGYEGFAHRVIARECDLSLGEVQYRLAKMGVSTQGYRSGMTDRALDRINRIKARWRLR